MAPRDKQLVARQFSRAASSYDSAAKVQQQVLHKLLNPQAHISGHWLDIGCGTGAALPLLAEMGADELSGIDLSNGMLEEARRLCEQQQIRCNLIEADADTIPLPDSCADGIISSLMLQWSEDTHATLTEWLRLLKPGGQLLVATLLPETHREIKQAWQAIDQRPHVNEFLPQETLLGHLASLGFQNVASHTNTLRPEYSSLTELLRYLKQIGATNVNPGRREGLGGREALRQLAEHYPVNAQSRYPLSYEVLWLSATKEEAAKRK